MDLSSTDILNFGYDKNTDTTFVGTRGGGVSRVCVKEWNAVTFASSYGHEWANLPSDTVHASFIEENGWQWFGTDAGLGYHQSAETKSGWTFFYKDSGMADDFVESIVRDKSGLLWVGTHDGVSSFDGVRWRNYSIADGLAGGVVYDIAVDHDGSLWFATDNGVSHYTGTTGVEIRRPVGSNAWTFKLMTAYPNPFNPSTSIPFSLSEPARVTAEVFDCAGRKILTIAEECFGSGAHVMVWTGMTSEGREAPTGVYMVAVRVQGRNGSEMRTIKIVLVR
jgi:hypothetical protein